MTVIDRARRTLAVADMLLSGNQMNAKQKQQVIKLLSKDCKIKRYYLDFNGDTCAIGCLALASGVSKSHLMSRNASSVVSVPCAHICASINAEFGLNEAALELIQIANDGCDTMAGRRKAVLKIVRDYCPLPNL